MKLPSYIRINTSDFQSTYQAMIAKLSVSVNNIIDSIMQALNNNISLTDNVYCSVNTVTVTVGANGNPTAATSFTISNTTLPTKPIGISVINVVNQVSSTGYPTSGVTVSYTWQNGTMVINNVTGLISGQAYVLTIVSWG